MNNPINSPAGYYQQAVHPAQAQHLQTQNIPQNPIPSSNIASAQPNDQFYPDAEIMNDGLIDPIQRSKELMGQLRISLQVSVFFF